jgi:IS1 family transposase
MKIRKRIPAALGALMAMAAMAPMPEMGPVGIQDEKKRAPKHRRGRRSRHFGRTYPCETKHRSAERRMVDSIALEHEKKNQSLPASRRLVTSKSKIRKKLKRYQRQIMATPESMEAIKRVLAEGAPAAA